MSGVNLPYQYPYEVVSPSQTQQVLGTNGAANDYLHRIVVKVATSASSTVDVFDGSTIVIAIPANTPVGVYSLDIGINAATGPFKVTTGAGAALLAVGLFSK
jgi:hypothetical protein